MSERQLHSAIGGSSVPISARQLRRRLRGGRLGYIMPRRIVDQCKCCYIWDTHISKSLSHDLNECRGSLLELCPSIWNGFTWKVGLAAIEDPGFSMRSWTTSCIMLIIVRAVQLLASSVHCIHRCRKSMPALFRITRIIGGLPHSAGAVT